MMKMNSVLYTGIFIVICSFMHTMAWGQTGINTKNPTHPLQVDAGKNNSTVPTGTEILDDVVITEEGSLGVGLLDPATRVDVRSADQKGIIGLGYTAQSAAAAGAGALRYETTDLALQYSDGVAWHTIPKEAPPKVLIMANKSVAQTNIAQNNNTQWITNWDVKVDAFNNFNASTGTFTAPRDGFYIVSFSITLASSTIDNNARIETIIESNTSTNNIQAFRSVNSYPSWISGSISNQVGGNCNAIFNLQEGNTIRFRIWHNLGGNRSIDTGDSGTRNSISIYEL